MTRVLVIDDERPFVRAVTISLRARGYDVDSAPTGEQGLFAAARGHPDVVVLDLGLPGIDGLDVLRSLRNWSDVPVIVLTARRSEATKVEAIDAGADDYITKPVGMNQLLARLQTTLRRLVPVGLDPVVTPEFRLDLVWRRATDMAGSSVRMNPTEWRVMEILIRKAGIIVTEGELVQQARGLDPDPGPETLRTCIAAICQKLEPDPSRPRHFITEPGPGYRYEP